MTRSFIDFEVNGITKSITVRDADTLLDVLRNQLGLTGAKAGCHNGDCGCCAILVDGTPIHACMMLAVEATGHKITTIEGLHDSPVPKAFLNHTAFQCGFCTPGFIINTHALVTSHPDANDEIIKEWLASNLCRCTSYTEIKEAVKAALKGQDSI